MGEFKIDEAAVRLLAGLLEETGLGEIEYEVDDRRIRVARPSMAAPAAVAMAAPVAAPASPGDARLAGAVTSPMVGTVYLSPAPGEPPLVHVGDTVAAGQPLMLIEAMKTFNEVKAPRAGRLASITIESGQPVEFGEVLAVIE